MHARTKVFCRVAFLLLYSMFPVVGGLARGNQDASLSQPIKLTVWHLWAADKEASRKPFLKVLQDWHVENPNIKLEAEAIASESYKMKIKIAVAANEAPDIFSTWGGGFSKPFVEAGRVLCIDPFVESEIRNKVLPGTLESFLYEGKLYGLPMDLWIACFYSNVDLLIHRGLGIAKTCQELRQAARVLGKDGVVPLIVGENDRWPGMFIYNILAIRTGGTDLCNRALNGEAAFDQPPFIEAASELRRLVEGGVFNPDALSISNDEAQAAFLGGKAAMFYMGNWAAGSMDGPGSVLKDKVAVSNFPVIENDRGDPNGFLGGASGTFMIASNTAHKLEAVKAQRYICEHFAVEAYLYGAGLPAWKFIINDSKLSALTIQISSLAKNASGFVLAWDTVLEPADAEIHKDLVAELFTGAITPRQFASAMQQQIQTKAK